MIYKMPINLSFLRRLESLYLGSIILRHVFGISVGKRFFTASVKTRNIIIYQLQNGCGFVRRTAPLVTVILRGESDRNAVPAKDSSRKNPKKQYRYGRSKPDPHLSSKSFIFGLSINLNLTDIGDTLPRKTFFLFIYLFFCSRLYCTYSEAL